MIPLALVRGLPWRWIGLGVVVLGIVGAFGWQVHQRHRAEDALAVATSRVAALEAAGRAQAEAVALMQAANDKAVTRLLGEKNAQIAAIDADRTSLAGRLHDAYARASRGPLREADPGPGGNAGTGGVARGAEEVDAALDAYDRACRRDAERLNFWVGYATAVGVSAQP